MQNFFIVSLIFSVDLISAASLRGFTNIFEKCTKKQQRAQAEIERPQEKVVKDALHTRYLQDREFQEMMKDDADLMNSEKDQQHLKADEGQDLKADEEQQQAENEKRKEVDSPRTMHRKLLQKKIGSSYGGMQTIVSFLDEKKQRDISLLRKRCYNEIIPGLASPVCINVYRDLHWKYLNEAKKRDSGIFGDSEPNINKVFAELGDWTHYWSQYYDDEPQFWSLVTLTCLSFSNGFGVQFKSSTERGSVVLMIAIRDSFQKYGVIIPRYGDEDGFPSLDETQLEGLLDIDLKSQDDLARIIITHCAQEGENKSYLLNHLEEQ